MTLLLRSDLYKLKKSLSFRVCLIISFVLGIVMSILYYYAWQQLNQNIEETTKMIASLGDYGQTVQAALELMPKNDLWSYVNISLSDLNVLYISAVVVSIFVGSEYSMGTLRNPLTRGHSRTKIYLSKLIVTTLASLAVIGLYTAGGTVSGCIMFGFSSSVSAGDILLTLLCYLLLFLAVVSFYVMVAVLTKKTGYAIAFSMIVPMLISSLASVIKIGYADFDKISRLWLFDTVISTQKLVQSSEAYIPMIAAAVYFALFTALGMLMLRKQEVK